MFSRSRVTCSLACLALSVAVESVLLLLHIREVTGSYLIFRPMLSCFLQSLAANVGIISEIRSRPLRSTYFEIYCSLIIGFDSL
jgi:hypothetical protein